MGATHDYFTLNRSRWQALNYLTKEKSIPPDEIDGGFEFNAWHSFDFTKYHPETNKRWWWIVKDNYMVTLRPMEGYTVIKEYDYKE